MVDQFPHIKIEKIAHRGQDRNPGIQLFGRRFPSDQSIQELLVEFLLVAASQKRVGAQTDGFDSRWPSLEMLHNWPDDSPLQYSPRARLNLKLFTFLGASKLETRHESHREKYRELIRTMQRNEHLILSSRSDKREVLRTLENLFLGFQGVGGSRTWCAQSFLPLSEALLANESIWQETKARRNNPEDWDAALDCFSHNQQIFLARGGELLYLQACNALGISSENIGKWFIEAGLSPAPDESSAESLHQQLTSSIDAILNAAPEAVNQLAAFIDMGIESDTSKKTDLKTDNSPKFTSCGWCPKESWPESLLFALEFSRICRAKIDPIDRIELLEIACAMQVLRSLCAQSARYVDWANDRQHCSGPLNYVWAFSDPQGDMRITKRISNRCLYAIQGLIFKSIRHPSILKTVEAQRNTDEAGGRPWPREDAPYREADSRYGYKLFLSLAKRIGLVVPKRGAGARFVLNDRILRYLVMSTIRPGQRVSYDRFKELLFIHFGIAVDDEKLGIACEWCGTQRLTTLGGNSESWLQTMLDAAGVFVRLSDSCSLVVNPFGDGD